jgi:hypothetical protein
MGRGEKDEVAIQVLELDQNNNNYDETSQVIS